MLELQFLPDGSPDCPLIRIFGADSTAYTLLHNTIVQLSSGKIREAAIDQLPGIVSIEPSHLSAITAKWDRGVIRSGDANEFEWRLTTNTWENVAGLLEPFCDLASRSGFQWIGSAGDFRVLVSTDGKW